MSNQTLASTWAAPEFDQVDDPQAIGLLYDEDRQGALEDPHTIFADSENRTLPVYVPIGHNTEANQAFFETDQPDAPRAYYFNWPGLAEQRVETEALVAATAQLEKGSRVLVEYRRETSEMALFELQILAGAAKRALNLDPSVIDVQAENMAGVHHFYSPINREKGHNPTAQTMNEAQQQLVENGIWEKFAQEGLSYVSGEDITPELLDELWDVYDKTFDNLVSNHPSAQKQPRDYFDQQTSMPESKVVFAREDGEIVSAIFLVEDATKCPWLRTDYFEHKNPNGKTIYVPGISTRMNMQGLNYSSKIIQAMATVVAETEPLTGFGTQCTNRSVLYIPGIAEANTVGTCNLKLENTANYLYPVFAVD